MAAKAQRLSYGIGAEISGVDISTDLTESQINEIKKLWYEHQIILFRGTELTLERQVAFGKRFGKLELHPITALRHPTQPEVFELTNRKINGKPSETAEIGRVWHSDGAFTVRPPTGSFLYCNLAPQAGGSTWFSSTYMAYDTLSSGMKEFLDSHEVVNDLYGGGKLSSFVANRDPAKAAKDRKDVPPVIQPMVRVHPETGRKALYVNPAVTRSIVGMTTDESEGILKFLFDHSIRPEFVYTHRWRPHDLILWDNRCCMHLAPGDYDAKTELRQMFRVTLEGEPHGRYFTEAAPLQAVG